MQQEEDGGWKSSVFFKMSVVLGRYIYAYRMHVVLDSQDAPSLPSKHFQALHNLQEFPDCKSDWNWGIVTGTGLSSSSEAQITNKTSSGETQTLPFLQPFFSPFKFFSISKLFLWNRPDIYFFFPYGS